LECPKHYSKFNLLTGSPDSFPATQPVPVYETKIESGQLKVVI
jgi:3-phenylpropionate/trans-cinnamate dioxygenase ferredoxin subunit